MNQEEARREIRTIEFALGSFSDLIARCGDDADASEWEAAHDALSALARSLLGALQLEEEAS